MGHEMDTLFEIILLLLEKLFAHRRLRKEQDELIAKHKSFTTSCTNCGTQMNSLAVFCPHCMHLIPQVNEMLQSHSNKQPHEFLKLSYKGFYKCPHCGTKPISTDNIAVKSPIIRCPNCNDFFLDISISEPYINKKPNRWETHFSTPLTICLITSAIVLFTKMPFGLWISVTAAAILTQVVFFKKDSSDSDSKSKLRVERNPNYLQCLADMGYLHKMTPKFRNMTSGYSNFIRCECCNSENSKTNAFCTACSAPLPTEKHTKKYLYPLVDDDEYESLSGSFLLKLCTVLLVILLCFIFVWFKPL